MGPKKAPDQLDQPDERQPWERELDNLFSPFLDTPFDEKTTGDEKQKTAPDQAPVRVLASDSVSPAAPAPDAAPDPVPSVDSDAETPTNSDDDDRPTPVWDPPADLGLPTPLLPSPEVDETPAPNRKLPVDIEDDDFSGHDRTTKPAPPDYDFQSLIKVDASTSVSPVSGATAAQIAGVLSGTHPSLRSSPIPKMYVVGDGSPRESVQPGEIFRQHPVLPNLDLSPQAAAIQESVHDRVSAVDEDDAPEIEMGEDAELDADILSPPEDSSDSAGREPLPSDEVCETIPSFPPLPLEPPVAPVEHLPIDPQDQCFMVLHEMDFDFYSLDDQIQQFEWKNRLLEPQQIQGVFLYILRQFVDHLSRHLFRNKTNVVQTKMGILTGKLVHRIAEFDKIHKKFVVDENTSNKISMLQQILETIPDNPSIEQLADAFIDQADFSEV